FFSSRRRHTRFSRDWSSDVCSSDLEIRLPGGRSCSINLSGQTLGDEGFLSFVVDALDHSGVAQSSICFEVTESTISTNVQQALQIGRASCRERGKSPAADGPRRETS